MMVEDIILDKFPKEAGVYLFKVDKEVIYVGSSNNIHLRMVHHRSYIRQGSAHGYKQDLYKYIQSNHFTVEFQLTDNYRQLEQELVEKYHPKYNAHRAFTGLGARKGREAEYDKERYQKYKEEILEQAKQYHKSDKGKESQKKAVNKYNNQLCIYNGETLKFAALKARFRKTGLSNPTLEAKKYLIKD